MVHYTKLTSARIVAGLFILLILVGNFWAALALTGQVVPLWLQACGRVLSLVTIAGIVLFLGEWAWKASRTPKESPPPQSP